MVLNRASLVCRSGEQLRWIVGEDRPSALRRRSGLLLRPAGRRSAVVANLFNQRAQGNHAGRRNRGYTLSDDGSKILVRQGPGFSPLRRDDSRRKNEESQFRPRVSTSIASRRRMEPDLQRSLAPLSRLVLRVKHARLRLGGAARTIQAAAQICRASFGFELCHQRDDFRIDRAARIYSKAAISIFRRGRVSDCRARGFDSIASRAVIRLRRSSPVKTKKTSIVRRSPRSA